MNERNRGSFSILFNPKVRVQYERLKSNVLNQYNRVRITKMQNYEVLCNGFMGARVMHEFRRRLIEKLFSEGKKANSTVFSFSEPRKYSSMLRLPPGMARLNQPLFDTYRPLFHIFPVEIVNYIDSYVKRHALGMIPIVTNFLFRQIEEESACGNEYRVSVRYIEINDSDGEVRDLLTKKKSKSVSFETRSMYNSEKLNFTKIKRKRVTNYESMKRLFENFFVNHYNFGYKSGKKRVFTIFLQKRQKVPKLRNGKRIYFESVPRCLHLVEIFPGRLNFLSQSSNIQKRKKRVEFIFSKYFENLGSSCFPVVNHKQRINVLSLVLGWTHFSCWTKTKSYLVINDIRIPQAKKKRGITDSASLRYLFENSHPSTFHHREGKKKGRRKSIDESSKYYVLVRNVRDWLDTRVEIEDRIKKTEKSLFPVQKQIGMGKNMTLSLRRKTKELVELQRRVVSEEKKFVSIVMFYPVDVVKRIVVDEGNEIIDSCLFDESLVEGVTQHVLEEII